MFPGGLHLNIYTRKPLDLPKLANLGLNDNQNGVTICYQIAIHNVTFGCSEKVLDDIGSFKNPDSMPGNHRTCQSWPLWPQIMVNLKQICPAQTAYLLFLHGSISLSFWVILVFDVPLSGYSPALNGLF